MSLVSISRLNDFADDWEYRSVRRRQGRRSNIIAFLVNIASCARRRRARAALRFIFSFDGLACLVMSEMHRRLRWQQADINNCRRR